MLDEPARRPVVPHEGGLAAETALAGLTVQASVPDARCARTVTGWEEMEEGFGGFPSPENSRDFFKNQPTRMKAKHGKLRRK